MLGEDHSLASEFPQYHSTIVRLVSSDSLFARDTEQYNALDREIRKLELQGAPISDEDMHQKKHDRSVLKDSLYQRLVDAGKP